MLVKEFESLRRAHRPGGIASSSRGRGIVTEAEDVLWSRTKIHVWVVARPRGARGRAPSRAVGLHLIRERSARSADAPSPA